MAKKKHRRNDDAAPAGYPAWARGLVRMRGPGDRIVFVDWGHPVWGGAITPRGVSRRVKFYNVYIMGAGGTRVLHTRAMRDELTSSYEMLEVCRNPGAPWHSLEAREYRRMAAESPRGGSDWLAFKSKAEAHEESLQEISRRYGVGAVGPNPRRSRSRKFAWKCPVCGVKKSRAIDDYEVQAGRCWQCDLKTRRNPGRAFSYESAKKAAKANAKYFGVPFAVFADTSGNWRATRLTKAPKNVPGGLEVFKPSQYLPGPKANPGTDMGSIARTPDFQKGLKLYHQIHGCDPKSIKRTILRLGPGDNKITGRVVLVSMGRAPADSYEPPKGSRKAGRIWVHPYDNKPEKVVTVDGKTIITMPGTHAVKAGPDGEAWIHG